VIIGLSNVDLGFYAQATSEGDQEAARRLGERFQPL
jgi:hypothetical protein